MMSPNPLELLGGLGDITESILIKTSPMLDWHKIVSDFETHKLSRGWSVDHVFIIGHGQECKELCLRLSTNPPDECQLTVAVLPNYPEDVQWSHTESISATYDKISPICDPAKLLDMDPAKPLWLWEPHACLMKWGAFHDLPNRVGVPEMSKIAPDSHLYTSETKHDLPGFWMRVSHVTSLDRKKLARVLTKDKKGRLRANVKSRNHPMTAPQIEQKYRFTPDDSATLVATQTKEKQSIVFVGYCE